MIHRNNSTFIQSATWNVSLPLLQRVVVVFMVVFVTACNEDDSVVSNVPPSAPSLTNPADGATDQSTTPTLSWTESTDGDGDEISYDIHLSTSNPPSLTSADVTGSSFTVATALENDTEYFWQVVAKDGNGGETSSDVWSFTTMADNGSPSAPNLSAPADQATGVSTLPELSWEASTDPDGDAVSYDVHLGTSNPPVLLQAGVMGTSLTPSSDLESDTEYFWQVIAKDGNGGETASAVRSFTTQPSNQAPTVPGLTDPAADATGVSITPTVSWMASTDADGDAIVYDLYLSDNTTPSLLQADISTTSFIVSTALVNETTYYWQVVAKDGNGGESASAVQSFTTEAQTTENVFDGNVIFFSNQSVVDFGANNYTQVTGGITVLTGSVTDLSPLSTLEKVDGNFLFSSFGGTSLAGLENLKEVGGFFALQNNSTVASLDALSSLESVGSLSFFNLPLIPNLDGLSSLTTFTDEGVGVKFQIRGLDLIENLNGLANLTTASGGMEISFNPKLTSIEGLAGLTSFEGSGIIISDNDLLASLKGLDNVTNINTLNSLSGNVTVEDNPMLTDFCSLFPLINSGNLAEADLKISGNGSNPAFNAITSCN